MSRPTSMSSRNLSLPEELEKLEQSITLTLQEIDHNFSRAHQIVTTSILPVVERYAEHSRAVWDGSKFWKEFFEASANVSLSGYEERPASDAEGDSRQDITGTSGAASSDADDDDSFANDNATATLSTVPQGTSTLESPTDVDTTVRSLLDSPSVLRGTPRGDPAPKIPANLTIAEYPSPYEALKQEHQAGPSAHAAAGPGTSAASASEDVAGMTAKLPAISQTPLRAAAQADPQTRRRHGGGRGGAAGEDVLLHRVLDKTYRIQATPHKTPASQIRTRRYHVSGLGGGSTKAGVDSSPPSSPEMPPPPQLNPDVFSPSTRRRIVAVNSAKKPRQAAGSGLGHATGMGAASGIGTRTPRPKLKPGVSVLHTPRQQQPPLFGAAAHASGRLFSSKKGGSRPGLFEADTTAARPSDNSEREHGYDEQAGASDSSSDEWGDIEGMSPPKTIQFAVPPSRLLRTPAKQASKLIVRDLLLTAGANSTTTTDVDTVELTRDIQRLAVRSRRLENDEREDEDDDDENDDDDDARVRVRGQPAYMDYDAEPHTRVYDESYDDNDDDGDIPVPDADADAEPTSPVIVKGRAAADLAEDTF